MSSRREAEGEQGFFVEVGAYHPFKYSNTLFFEKCLGWKGLLVEPNPYNHPLFRAYRKADLVPHCTWSHETTVTTSFTKDMIEAAVPEDTYGGNLDPSVGVTGSLPGIVNLNESYTPEKIKQKQDQHAFDAVCLSLEQILDRFMPEPTGTRAGMQKRVDFMAIDAEHAEVEIIKTFPFEKFDVRVFLIEVQIDNYYMLDAILLNNGYGKVGILGGDHVYIKLGNFQTKLALPSNVVEEQILSNSDFHSHKAPKTKLS